MEQASPGLREAGLFSKLGSFSVPPAAAGATAQAEQPVPRAMEMGQGASSLSLGHNKFHWQGIYRAFD